LALGYFLAYAPYSALIKATTTGLWPGVGGPVSGFRLLPAVVVSTAVTLPLFIWVKGWWGYAGRRRLFGRSVPLPGGLVLLSGVGTAVIIWATTLAFTFKGVSIVLALVLMRGGVLIVASAVDFMFKRRVRWFSWAALALSMVALLVALADVNNYSLTPVAALTIAAYVAGYVLRLPCINRLAKSEDAAVTRRYFVEEVSVATALLVLVPALLALLGAGEVGLELRRGFADFFVSEVTLPAVLIGAFYTALYCFGTLIYLDCRENTFCVPLNRCSSLLAGVFAACAFALFLGQQPPSRAQFIGAGLIAVALLLLSPLHHFRRSLGRLGDLLAGVFRTPHAAEAYSPPVTRSVAAEQEQFDKLRRIFLFVCSGNTCRSPMAAAIGNAELAARLKVPVEALCAAGVRAESAGLSVSAGAPMTAEAQQTLSRMGVAVMPHAARGLTADLAHEVERIFCMTQAHRSTVVSMFPSAAGKTRCLDPHGDIEDPLGKGIESYLSCAERIRGLMRSHLDEMGLQGG
jgi:protein-tyrosine-phosphatase